MKIKHPLMNMAYATLDWYLPDRKETYDQHIKENYVMLKDNGWIDYKPFTYKFNSLGFRSNEISDNNLLALGCSYTFGTGIPYESTWPYLVSQKLGLNCLNYGVPGSSPFTAFRIAYQAIEMVNPQVVLFLCPPNDRMSVCSSLGIYDIGPWVFKENKEYYKYFSKSAIEYYKDFIMLEENLLLQEAVCRLAIEQLCNKLSIKFLNLYLTEFPTTDWARDLKHTGIKSNRNFANKVIGQL